MKLNASQQKPQGSYFASFLKTFLFGIMLITPFHYFIMNLAITPHWLTETIFSSLLFSLVFTSTTKYARKKINKTQRN
jgi:hypothetical protein